MTFLELVQRLHSESLRSTAAPTSVSGATDRNARLFNRIADAWRNLQNERLWRWMRVTTDVALVAGQQTYSDSDLSLTRPAGSTRSAPRSTRARRPSTCSCATTTPAGPTSGSMPCSP